MNFNPTLEKQQSTCIEHSYYDLPVHEDYLMNEYIIYNYLKNHNVKISQPSTKNSLASLKTSKRTPNFLENRMKTQFCRSFKNTSLSILIAQKSINY